PSYPSNIHILIVNQISKQFALDVFIETICFIGPTHQIPYKKEIQALGGSAPTQQEDTNSNIHQPKPPGHYSPAPMRP
ncbi:MAG: hypothetical protein Q4A97_06160, partial [Comamonadaceae bacterium]|nr:hypothetical protein [Comamonadaceae bacterium]